VVRSTDKYEDYCEALEKAFAEVKDRDIRALGGARIAAENQTEAGCAH